MFTDFYKKIIIPARTPGSSLGYFWNTNLAEQVTILNGARDIYGNYLMNYTTPAGATGTQLYNLNSTENVANTTIGKLFTNQFTNYYDKDNDQWVTSSSGLSNYFSASPVSDYFAYYNSGVGTTSGNSNPYYAPLYSDALMVWSYPNGNNYGYAVNDYIMIGTGNTANTSSTYQLEAPVSAADCNFSISKAINGYNITIINKKNTDLTISELGYCVGVRMSTLFYSDLSTTTNVVKASDIPTYWNGLHHINTFTVQGLDNAGFNRNFYANSYHIMNTTAFPMLCCRTVLPNPITIAAGERITITWNFELDI